MHSLPFACVINWVLASSNEPKSLLQLDQDTMVFLGNVQSAFNVNYRGSFSPASAVFISLGENNLKLFLKTYSGCLAMSQFWRNIVHNMSQKSRKFLFLNIKSQSFFFYLNSKQHFAAQKFLISTILSLTVYEKIYVI